jgi:hypothetical protein
MTPVEILTQARDLIAQPGKWTQGWYARRADGKDCYWADDEASCFCAVGAVEKTVGFDFIWSASHRKSYEYLREVVGGVVDRFNDDPTRTQEEVVQAFDKAIELAKAEA